MGTWKQGASNSQPFSTPLAFCLFWINHLYTFSSQFYFEPLRHMVHSTQTLPLPCHFHFTKELTATTSRRSLEFGWKIGIISETGTRGPLVWMTLESRNQSFQVSTAGIEARTTTHGRNYRNFAPTLGSEHRTKSMPLLVLLPLTTLQPFPSPPLSSPLVEERRGRIERQTAWDSSFSSPERK